MAYETFVIDLMSARWYQTDVHNHSRAAEIALRFGDFEEAIKQQDKAREAARWAMKALHAVLNP